MNIKRRDFSSLTYRSLGQNTRNNVIWFAPIEKQHLYTDPSISHHAKIKYKHLKPDDVERKRQYNVDTRTTKAAELIHPPSSPSIHKMADSAAHAELTTINLTLTHFPFSENEAHNPIQIPVAAQAPVEVDANDDAGQSCRYYALRQGRYTK